MSFSQPPARLPDTRPFKQWQYLRKNAGTWAGLCTRISAQGQILSSDRTKTTLIPKDTSQTLHQKTQQHSAHGTAHIDQRVLCPQPSHCFSTGAFSQGPLQWQPSSPFELSLSLLARSQRLRLIVSFNDSHELSQLTLIHEQWQDAIAPSSRQEDAADSVSNQLPVEFLDLLGIWESEYTSLSKNDAEMTTASAITSNLSKGACLQTYNRLGDYDSQLLVNDVNILPAHSLYASAGKVVRLKVGKSESTQIMQLSDTVFCRLPVVAQPRQSPLVVELIWHFTVRSRQRMIRSYDPSGEWKDLTLLTEHKSAEANTTNATP